MSISTRFILPVLLAAVIGGVPTLASAQPFLPGYHHGGPGGPPRGPGGWHGGPRGPGGWHGGPGGPGGYRGHGGYYRHDRGGDDGAGAAVAAGIIGLAVGAMAAGAARNAYRGDSHVRWCLNRYRSYDPDSDTYVGYDGRRHYCR